MAIVTASRSMPPWKATSSIGTFAGDRRLNAGEVAIFQAWLDQGRLEGDPEQAPRQPEWPGGWQLGQPDLVLTMTAPYTLRAGGPDMFRNFTIPISLDRTRYIRAWEFHPGNPRAVHHATFQIDPLRTAQAFDAGERESGYEGLVAPSARAPDGFFLDWAPGHRPSVAANGTAWPLPADSGLVMMLHLRPTGRAETIQASVGLYFSDSPPTRIPVMLRLTREDLVIPPGEKQYHVADSYVLPADVDVYTVQPHAHYLATQIRGTARRSTGPEQLLISIDHWDFDWQDVYAYTKPISLPKGTTLRMDVEYDNSSNNPKNPHQPPVRVTYGQQTSDEMAELWLQVVPHTDQDRAVLIESLRSKVIPQEVAGRRLMLEKDPANASLHNELALLHAEVGDREAVLREFAAALRLSQNSAAALYNVGQALIGLGRNVEAWQYFERSLKIKPDYSAAHVALGQLLQADRQYEAAISHYQDALRPRPDDPETLLRLGVISGLVGRRQDGVARLRRALKIRPDWPAAMGSLAWLLAVSPAATDVERKEAIEQAKHANRLVPHNPNLLDILATTLAAAGRFDDAIPVAREAAALSRASADHMLVDPIQRRLDLFERHIPYLER
jgi:tetratricopeptide (TPR) repeat protein